MRALLTYIFCVLIVTIPSKILAFDGKTAKNFLGLYEVKPGVLAHDRGWFGKNREGNIKYLEQNKNIFNIDIISIPKQSVDKISISSTKIREHLINGKIQTANQLLGRKYSINGKVVRGNGIGRKINFPTANIQINEPKKLLPKNGVYAVEVILNNKTYLGMLNIGYNPTIENEKKSIEVNIFKFSDEVYNNKILINFIKRIRNEKKFKNLNELKKQLIIDKKKVKLI